MESGDLVKGCGEKNMHKGCTLGGCDGRPIWVGYTKQRKRNNEKETGRKSWPGSPG